MVTKPTLQRPRVRFSYSTLGFKDRDIHAVLDAIGAAGFDHAEICALESDMAMPPEGEALRRLRTHLDERGITAGTVHAPMRRYVAPGQGPGAGRPHPLRSRRWFHRYRHPPRPQSDLRPRAGLDWSDIRAALIEIGYSGFWTFEACAGRRNETPEEVARLTRRFADEWSDDT